MKPIPLYTGLLASEDGHIYYADTGDQLLEYRSKAKKGYYMRVTARKDGKPRRQTTSIHVLVCLAYHGLPPVEFIRPEVNHIDLDKTNNHYTNLEWCTSSQNKLHSWQEEGRGGNFAPVWMKDHRTGEIRRFDRTVQFMAYSGLPEGTCWRMLNGKLINGMSLVRDTGKEPKFKSYNPDYVLANVTAYLKMVAWQVEVYDYKTGLVTSFKSMGHFLRQDTTGITRSTVQNRLTDKNPYPINGLSFRWSGERIEFPELDETQIGYSFIPGYRAQLSREVELTNTVTGEVLRFPDRVKVADHLGIPVHRVREVLEGRSQLDDYQVRYFQ